MKICLTESARIRSGRFCSPWNIRHSSVEGQRTSGTHTLDIRDFAQPLVHTIEKGCTRLRLHQWDLKHKRQNVRRFVTGIDMLKRIEAAEHQTESNEKNEREGEFRDHDRTSEPTACSQSRRAAAH